MQLSELASNISIKLLVVGNSGVGKTSLCNRYTSDTFSRCHKPTVGVEFYTKEYKQVSEDRTVKLHFWDIGGQERYISMTHVYYKNADFCLILFDLTNKESFLACQKWKNDLDKKHELSDGSKCPCLLIGNKCDLPNRVLEQSEIEDFCKKNEFFGYIELSVKKNIMVSETMNYIAEQAIKCKEKIMSTKTSKNQMNRIGALHLKAKDQLEKCGCLSLLGFDKKCNSKCC